MHSQLLNVRPRSIPRADGINAKSWALLFLSAHGFSFLFSLSLSGQTMFLQDFTLERSDELYLLDIRNEVTVAETACHSE